IHRTILIVLRFLLQSERAISDLLRLIPIVSEDQDASPGSGATSFSCAKFESVRDFRMSTLPELANFEILQALYNAENPITIPEKNRIELIAHHQQYQVHNGQSLPSSAMMAIHRPLLQSLRWKAPGRLTLPGPFHRLLHIVHIKKSAENFQLTVLQSLPKKVHLVDSVI